MTSNAAIDISYDTLTACGSEEDPSSRMVGMIELNGSPFEVIAYAVNDARAQETSDPLFLDNFDRLRAALSSQGTRFQTVSLRDRNYALFVIPVLSLAV